MTTQSEAMAMTEEQLAKLNPRHILAMFKRTRNFGYHEWYTPDPWDKKQDDFHDRLKRVLAGMPHVERVGRRSSVRQERLRGRKELRY